MGIAESIKVNNGLNALLDELVLMTGDLPEVVLYHALKHFKQQLESAAQLGVEIATGKVRVVDQPDYTHFDSLIAKLTDCRKLQHGEFISDEEFGALIQARGATV